MHQGLTAEIMTDVSVVGCLVIFQRFPGKDTSVTKVQHREERASKDK